VLGFVYRTNGEGKGSGGRCGKEAVGELCDLQSYNRVLPWSLFGITSKREIYVADQLINK
jgi:hypothetical protein